MNIVKLVLESSDRAKLNILKMPRLKKFLPTIVVIAILILAFILRLHRLEQLMTFTFDQGRDLYALQTISRGKLTLIGPTTGIQGVFLGPFYFYFLLPGFLLTGGSPFGVMVWVSFWTTAALALFYLIMRKMVGMKWALLALVLMAILPGSIREARVIWNPSLAVPTLLASFYLLFKSKEKAWLLIPSLFFYGLALQTELAYAVFLFPAYLWWWWKHNYLLSNQDNRKYNWKTIILAVAALAITLAPQALFELRHNFIMTKSLMAQSQKADYKVPLSQVWSERPSQIAATMEDSLFGITYPSQIFFIILLLVILSLATSTKLKSEEKFFLLIFILPIFGMMMHTGNYGYFFDYYLSPHYLPALALIIIFLKRLFFGKYLSPFITIVFAVYFLAVAEIIYSPTALNYTMDKQLQALKQIRAQQIQAEVGLEVYVPNLLPINYQYLNEWMARKPEYGPVNFGVNEQHQEYYLIYEGAPVAQEFTFNPWYEHWTSQGECGEHQQFGIIHLERCVVN